MYVFTKDCIVINGNSKQMRLQCLSEIKPNIVKSNWCDMKVIENRLYNSL